MFLIHVTIPRAEGDWDICFRVDFLLSSHTASPRTFQTECDSEKASVSGALRNLQSAEQGIHCCLHQWRSMESISKFKSEASSIYSQEMSYRNLQRYLVFVIVSDWSRFTFVFSFSQFEQYLYWIVGLHMDSVHQ